MNDTSQQGGFAGKLDRWIRSHPVVVLLIVAAVVVSSLFTLVQGVDSVIDLYRREFAWKSDEYAKIRKLHAGVSVQYFDELMGPPLLIRDSQNGTLTERDYRERGYWVQAIANAAGTVQLLAVTSCGDGFEPTIHSPVATVTLNRSTFASVGTPYKLRYQGKAGSLGTWFDEYGPGNPAFYKSYFFGVSDACAPVAFDYDSISHDIASVAGEDGVLYDPSNSAVAEFRTNSIVNTFAETDLFTDPAPILREFSLGVSYVDTRVVDFNE